MANNSSDELNVQGVLGSPRHISGDKSTIAPAAPPTERAACIQFGGVHAQRREGNIHRSLAVSTMSKPWVSATSCPRGWLCSGVQPSTVHLLKAYANTSVSLSYRRRSSCIFFRATNMDLRD